MMSFKQNRKQKAVFLDMDDVVCDWVAKAIEYLGVPDLDDDLSYSPAKWQQLLEFERFYRDLSVKQGAYELVAWAKQHVNQNDKFLAFLTAMPHDNSVPYVFHDKIIWAEKHFPDIPVFFGPYSYDKARHCKTGDILIDDRRSNCEEWRSAGGIAHEYTTWKNCKNWIITELGDDI